MIFGVRRMDMKRNNSFFTSMGFYVLLGIGLIALVSLLVYYSGSDDVTNQNTEMVDLNEGVRDSADASADRTEKKNDGETKPEKTTTEETAAKEKENSEDVFGKKDNTKQEFDPGENGYGTGAKEVIDNNADNDEDNIEVASYNGEQALSWPMAGNVILPYSMETTVYYKTLDAYKCNPGILIEGQEGADVYAAYNGVVKSITNTPDRGTVVTVDIGNGYETSYGQLMNVTVAEGESIATNKNIGEIAPVSSYYTKEGNHLYFEVTKDGIPVDPMLLIE